MSNVIGFALRQRVLVIVLFAMTLIGGIAAFLNLNIEAYPDPVPPIVDIITQDPGQPAEDMERYITIPIEIQMAGIPNVRVIRTVSLFGLSDVVLQFTYDFTYEEAQQWVINRLSQLPALKNGAQPVLSRESPLGEIYRYRVAGPKGYSIADLKTIQDWILERRFKAVPGVVDTVSWGGKTKTYNVNIDQRKLVSYGLTLPEVLQSLNNSNINVGGQTVNIGPQAAVVRGIGVIRSMDDIRSTVLASVKGTPVLLNDVATVEVGYEPRLGIAGLNDDDDVVQGIVMMRRGQQTKPTLLAVEAEAKKINGTGILPPGVRIERIYDRSGLIRLTTGTVLRNMIEGMALIFLIQWVFLGSLRSAVIVAATIPFALFIAVIVMKVSNESANLLSVGAIDFGLVVDATVIMVENLVRHLGAAQPQAAHDSSLMRLPLPPLMRRRLVAIEAGASQVTRAIFFSAAIIVAGFVPLFTMSGVEGHIFGPMAKTYAYAIAGGLLATFTVTPVLAGYLLPEHIDDSETNVMAYLMRGYERLLHFVFRNKRETMAACAILFFFAVLCSTRLGTEFLPHLEEGNLWIRGTMPQSISLEEGNSYVNRMRKVIASYPEVENVVSQHGRPDDGTDATGFFNTEFFAPLKPFDQWPEGVDKEKLTGMMKKHLESEFPGVDFSFSQYIEDNIQESVSGVKGENTVKLFGNDLAQLEKIANRIKPVLETVPGITDLGVFALLGQPTISINIDRTRAARYGLSPEDINTTVEAAIGGKNAGKLYEDGSDRNFSIKLRLTPEYRADADAMRRIPVGVQRPDGGVMQIPLADVADVKLITGPAFIYRESQQRYIPVKFSVRGRDLGSTIQEAQAKIAREVQLPDGYRLEWVGEYSQYLDALQRLAIIVPLSIFLIGFLLYMNFGSVRDALLGASVIPMALTGGIYSLYVTDTAFSVSAAIGFVALFGVAAMDGIIVLSTYNRMIGEGLDKTQAIFGTCRAQMRPVAMTCIVAGVGLLPAALSSGIGSQVQKPLALVVVGGMTLAPFLILTVLPVLIDTFSLRAGRRDEPLLQPQPAE